MCPSKDRGVYYCCNAAAVKSLMLLLLLRLFIQGEGTVCVHLPACFPSPSVQCMDDYNPASQIHLELSGGGERDAGMKTQTAHVCKHIPYTFTTPSINRPRLQTAFDFCKNE